MLDTEMLRQLVTNALREDIGNGDHSTLSTIDPNARGKALLKVKENGIIAGLEIAGYIFHLLDPGSSIHFNKRDGESMKIGEIAFEVDAAVHAILMGERLVLNIMQRMSGIATLTRKYVDALKGYHTRILDTRKTTPNFRLLEKEAVRIGGAVNHRFGLYDMIMLKDNHIDYCGSIEKAILMSHDYVIKNKLDLKIEVETRNLEDVNKVLHYGKGKVFRVMLDNFSTDELKAAVKMVDAQMETEASGGIQLENLISYAETGVDYVSVGSLIHQARSLDLSLKAVK